MIEVAMKVQDLMLERGLGLHDLMQVFRELDENGTGDLDWPEFKAAMQMLQIKLPVANMRLLFRMFGMPSLF